MKKIKGDKEKASYSIGVNCAMYLARDMSIGAIIKDLDVNVMLEGIKDSLLQNEPKITHEEMHEAITKFREKANKAAAKASEAKEKEGRKFLEDNAKKDGVKVLESGLQYIVTADGEGESPKIDDNVVVHYRGTLIDGTEFDSSYSRGEPTTFKPNQVIPGWTEALMMMKPGSEWKVFLPPEIAYGERGAPPSIGPNETLVFDIKLEAIK